MPLPAIINTLPAAGRSLVQRLSYTLQDRQRLSHWLRSARKAHMALVLVLLYQATLSGSVNASLADALYPPPKPHFARRLAQIFAPATDQKHPRWDAGFALFERLSWLLLLLPAGLLIQALPRPVGPTQSTLVRTRIDTDAPSHPSAPLLGGRYQLQALIAEGGAGQVWRAQDLRLERPVAVKKLLGHWQTDSTMLTRFRTEALTLANLNHPNILQVFDLLEEHGSSWLVMEWLTGGTLSEKIRAAGKLPAGQALAITRQLVDALALAHGQGIIHRDIKPDNILFDHQGRPKLSDFGIARSARNSLQTQLGLVMGSPGYMSPEQAAGEPVSAQSDLYSLGVTLYEMLSGQLPFSGETTQVLMKHISQMPPLLAELMPALPEPLTQLVQSLLAKSPDQRPAGTDALRTLLSPDHLPGTDK